MFNVFRAMRSAVRPSLVVFGLVAVVAAGGWAGGTILSALFGSTVPRAVAATPAASVASTVAAPAVINRREWTPAVLVTEMMELPSGGNTIESVEGLMIGETYYRVPAYLCRGMLEAAQAGKPYRLPESAAAWRTARPSSTETNVARVEYMRVTFKDGLGALIHRGYPLAVKIDLAD